MWVSQGTDVGSPSLEADKSVSFPENWGQDPGLEAGRAVGVLQIEVRPIVRGESFLMDWGQVSCIRGWSR